LVYVFSECDWSSEMCSSYLFFQLLIYFILKNTQKKPKNIFSFFKILKFGSVFFFYRSEV
jgi:hypothetical protein